MKTIQNTLLLIFVVSLSALFSGCDDGLGGWNALTSNSLISDSQVNSGVYNGDMEEESSVQAGQPAGWRLSIENFSSPNNYQNGRTTDFSASDSNSIFISTTSIDNVSEYAVFRQRIMNPSVPIGSFVRFKFKVKTEQLSGRGFVAYLWVINRQGYFPLEASRNVSGTTDWAEYISEEIQVLDNLDELRLHVGINSNTTGKVFFDDVVIEYNEQ